ncbi:MFS transporter [Sphingomonas jatrophae]|uniref:Predicted arabinose efflux permease, MFS family n=1 Tax=Sphingomonas jatrophae TaxID=1166337 RepID=A0A1I6M4N2_9SPHN|nr:MFS transporter [Sphingomonas jatrophae]SFS10646.1 Predicted arabinose efflux permease, MFS family [Sphingomonas jatrophae]
MDAAAPHAVVGVPPGWRGRVARASLLGASPLMALMFAALGPVVPTIADHFGGRTGGAFAAQMILTMPAIGVILGGIAGGFSVERFGPRPVLIAALTAYGLLGVSGFVIESLPLLLATRLLLGFCVAQVGTAIGVVVGGWYEGVARAKLLGYQSAVAGVFAVSGLILSGLLAEVGGWRAPFLLYLLAFAILALAVTLPRDVARTVRAGARPSLRPLTRLWPVYALAMFLFVNYFMTSIQLSFLLAEDGVKSALARSLVIATGVLAGGICGGFYGRFYARLGERGTQILLTLMMAAGLALIGFSGSLVGQAVGAALSGGGGGMIPPHISGILLNRVPAELRARAVGLEFTVLYIADFLNPLVMTPLRAAVGTHNAFIVAALALLAAAGVMLLRKR